MRGKVVVTKVNGKEITREDVVTMQQSFASQGQEISEQEAVEYSIDRELLAQETEKQGLIPPAQRAEEMLKEEVARQGATIDSLKEQLKSHGQSYDEILESYRIQAGIQQFIDSKVETPQVDPSEAKEFFEQNKQQLAAGGQLPNYEAVKEEIEAYLKQQKQQVALSHLVGQLRTEADIVYSK